MDSELYFEVETGGWVGKGSFRVRNILSAGIFGNPKEARQFGVTDSVSLNFLRLKYS